MTREEAWSLVADLADAWPQQQIGPGTVDTYVTNLLDFPADLGHEAVAMLVTKEWFPTINRVRSAILERRVARAKAAQDYTPELWVKCRRCQDKGVVSAMQRRRDGQIYPIVGRCTCEKAAAADLAWLRVLDPTDPSLVEMEPGVVPHKPGYRKPGGAQGPAPSSAPEAVEQMAARMTP